jgi:hypothetical protein
MYGLISPIELSHFRLNYLQTIDLVYTKFEVWWHIKFILQGTELETESLDCFIAAKKLWILKGHAFF